MPYPTPRCPLCRDRGHLEIVEVRAGSPVLTRQACSCARRFLVVRAARIGREWMVATLAGVVHSSDLHDAFAAAGGVQ